MKLHELKVNHLKNKAEKAKKSAEKREERHNKEMEREKLKEEIKEFNSRHNKGLEHRDKIKSFVGNLYDRIKEYRNNADEREEKRLNRLKNRVGMEKQRVVLEKAKADIRKTRQLGKEKMSDFNIFGTQSFFKESKGKRTKPQKTEIDKFGEKEAKEWGMM